MWASWAEHLAEDNRFRPAILSISGRSVVRTRSPAPGGVHVSPVSMFTFASDFPARIVARRWLPLVSWLFHVLLVAVCESGRVPGVLMLLSRCPAVTRVFMAGVPAGGMIGAAG